MRFMDKLNLLIGSMGCTNADISRECGLDPSLLSRFRNGLRVPTRESAQLMKLCAGVTALLTDMPNREKIMDECGIEIRLSARPLYNELEDWLYSDDTNLKPARSRVSKKQTERVYLRDFHVRLDMLMSVYNISNARLARYLNLDASLVSRFRSGIRTPSITSPVFEKICRYFAEKPNTHKQVADMLELMDVSPRGVDFDSEDELYIKLVSWLGEKQIPAEFESIDSFLEWLDGFDGNLKALSDCAQSAASEECSCGVQGMRCATLTFLESIISAPAADSVLWYCDQSIDWLTSDESFTARWLELMKRAIEKGNKFKVIHSASRKYNELIGEIKLWLPLYFLGGVSASYCKIPSDSRFSHTLLVAQGAGAIISSCIKGGEELGEYTLSTDAASIERAVAQFKLILDDSAPLLEVFTIDRIEEFSSCLSEIESLAGDAVTLHPTLSLYTMPTELLKKILIRNKISEAEQERIIRFHALRRNSLRVGLMTNSVTALVAVASEAEVFAGEIGVNISGFLTNRRMYYTREEYIEHLNAVKQLGEETNNYRFRPLAITPFKNIQIVMRGGSVIVVKNNAPCIAFRVKKPLLYDTFLGYLENIVLASARKIGGVPAWNESIDVFGGE